MVGTSPRLRPCEYVTPRPAAYARDDGGDPSREPPTCICVALRNEREFAFSRSSARVTREPPAAVGGELARAFARWNETAEREVCTAALDLSLALPKGTMAATSNSRRVSGRSVGPAAPGGRRTVPRFRAGRGEAPPLRAVRPGQRSALLTPPQRRESRRRTHSGLRLLPPIPVETSFITASRALLLCHRCAAPKVRARSPYLSRATDDGVDVGAYATAQST